MKIRLRSSKLAGGLGLLLALVLIIALGVPAGADFFPSEYHQFLGSVKICDELVLTGDVTVNIEEDTTVVWTTTTPINASGNYGYTPDFLMIPVDDPETPGIKEGGEDGDTVRFYVQGRLAGEFIFEAGEGTVLDLQVTDVYLTVNVVGDGDVEVNDVAPVAYPAEYTFDCSTVVDLEAIPAGGWEFTGWSGALSDTENPTTIPMDGDKSVTANFTETGPDTTPPEVDSTVPVDDATGVSVDTLVTATFSEAIDVGTIDFTLDSVVGNTSYADTTATFDPNADLAYSTTYNASIEAEDLAGNPMAAPYTWSFTTEGPPDGLTIALVEGVNIIAYTGVTTNLPGALTNIGPAGLDVVDIIWARGAWTGGEWLYYDPGLVLNTLSQLEAGRAYIIVVTQDCTWELPQ